jgi:multiple sugar transport system permease protein
MFSELSLKNLRGIRRREKMRPLARREALWGFVFLSPWIIGFFLWTLIPMLASLVFSFTDFNLVHPEDINWIGFDNYTRLFRDPVVRKSALVSLRFAAIAVPIGILQPILMAALLNSKGLWAKRVFVTMFYMPFLVPLVSGVYIWQGMMNSKTGWINKALEAIGVTGPAWLDSTTWIYPALVIIGLWGVGNMLLYTLSAMQGIPTELYEAAKVDGAGPVRSFTYITIPMITPIIFYNLILSVIGIVQYFIVPFVLKGPSGHPGNATMFYALQLYKQAFTYSDMGYGATMAWMMFLFVLIATLILFATQKYWVFSAEREA